MEQKKRKPFLENLKDRDYRRVIVDISLAVLVTCCLVILFFFSVQRYDGLKTAWTDFKLIISPFIIGFGMAFLMNPIMKFFEERIIAYRIEKTKDEKKMRKRVRAWTSILALIILLALIFVFIWMIVPQIISAGFDIYNNLDKRIDAVLDWCKQITFGRFDKELEDAKNSDYIKGIQMGIDWILNYFGLSKNDLLSQVTSGAISMLKLVFNFIIGAIVSVYVLCSKETFKAHIKKLIYGFFKPAQGNIIMEVLRKTNSIFYGFIIGKIIDSIIIGIICYICCLIMKMPYAVLVSVIVGTTNIIPVFGPYIGAVPTVIIIFLTEPWKGIYFLIFVLILQQIDGNIIGPKILGDSTGLSSFWVVVAIVVGGGLFGVPGMIIGVPTMAVIYYIFGRIARYMARRRGLPAKTSEYIELNHIDEATGAMILNEPKDLEEKKIHFFTKKSDNEDDKTER